MTRKTIEEPKTPKGEHAWVGFYTSGGALQFIITSKKENRDMYFLYEVKEEQFIKLGKSKDVSELTRKYNVYEKIREI